MDRKRVVLAVLGLLMLVNIVLSAIVQTQKYAREHGDLELLEKCFDVGGGCETVQSSIYANTLGISNPIYGLVFFSLLAIGFGILLAKKQQPITVIFAMAIVMFAGMLFSTWLLYLQFFVLKATCIYCLWVDGIMLTSGLVFFIMFWKQIKNVLDR